MLAARISVPMAQDIKVINKTSQNLHAEMLLRLLGKTFGSDGSFEEGTRVVRQFLVDAGIDNNDFFFYDGSGLSPKDKISPRAFTRLLAYASHQPWGAAWRDTLPIAGVDGTLDKRFKNTPFKGRMWAKTGTLDEVNALSGYVTAASGRVVAFRFSSTTITRATTSSSKPSTASPKPSPRRSERCAYNAYLSSFAP